MPQLNPEFFVSQLFWLVVTFSFLLLFLWKVSLPRIGSVLEKRENKINNDIETAKQLQIEAEKMQNQIEKQLLDAQEEASDLIKNSTKNLQNNASKEILKLNRKLNKKIDETAVIIENNKKESLKKIHRYIHDITKSILTKLVKVSVNEQEIEESITNVQSKIRN